MVYHFLPPLFELLSHCENRKNPRLWVKTFKFDKLKVWILNGKKSKQFRIFEFMISGLGFYGFIRLAVASLRSRHLKEGEAFTIFSLPSLIYQPGRFFPR
jgi:hypothetical protein